MSKQETTPRERADTPRAAIRAELEGRAMTARELSARTSVSEKEVVAHLEHLDKSVRRDGKRLVIEPAKCLACGFSFDKRARFTAPGSCPECRSERITPPAFRVA
jgi:hypothetical protein